jgi:hypothetical protein
VKFDIFFPLISIPVFQKWEILLNDEFISCLEVKDVLNRAFYSIQLWVVINLYVP